MRFPVSALLASALAATTAASSAAASLRSLGGEHGSHSHDSHSHMKYNLVNVRNSTSYNNLESQCICSGTFRSDVDYFPEKIVNPTDAVGFNVTYHKYYKVLTNRRTSKVYVLVQCGAPEPPASEITASTYTTISIPLTKVATRSTTYLPMIETLGERETIKKVVGKCVLASFDGIGASCEAAGGLVKVVAVNRSSRC